MADSPASSLSEHASEEFEEDVKIENGSDMDEDEDPSSLHAMRPLKKHKTSLTGFKATPEPVEYDDDDISSDTSGEAPSSPGAPNQTGEDEGDQQVTICKWRGCTAGDLGNMDKLVTHIHETHVLQRQKKYACEWDDCHRKDAQHASGYALRAHMRSHTREKPFYCTLPECDKAFTRSDALAKHMRTVHETEALRPSDPVPRNHSYNTAPKQKLKLFMKPHISEGDVLSPSEAMDAAALPIDFELTDEESVMSPDRLYKVWRRKVHWAEQEGLRLRLECEKLEKTRKDEWHAKELLLTNLIEADLAVELNSRPSDEEFMQNAIRIKDAMLPQDMLPMHGEPLPFYRQMDNMSVGSLDNVEAAANTLINTDGAPHQNGVLP